MTETPLNVTSPPDPMSQRTIYGPANINVPFPALEDLLVEEVPEAEEGDNEDAPAPND